jgi:hypothetical protein
MGTNDSGDKKSLDNVGLVALFVCASATAIFWLGGASWPAAVAVCSLSGMGFGVCYLMLKK